ncbi:hypothetical protein GCM10010404_91230 [Nonomuraea africana]
MLGGDRTHDGGSAPAADPGASPTRSAAPGLNPRWEPFPAEELRRIHPASTTRRTSSATPSNDAPTASSSGAGIATRYDKTATIYLAGLHIAEIFLWSAR